MATDFPWSCQKRSQNPPDAVFSRTTGWEAEVPSRYRNTSIPAILLRAAGAQVQQFPVETALPKLSVVAGMATTRFVAPAAWCCPSSSSPLARTLASRGPGLVQLIRKGRVFLVLVVVKVGEGVPLKNILWPGETVSAERQRLVLGLVWGSGNADGLTFVAPDPIENRASGLFANV